MRMDQDGRHGSLVFILRWSWTMNYRLGLLLKEPRKFAHLLERIADRGQGAPQVIRRKSGMVLASRADWVDAGKSAASIAVRASSENFANDPSLPISPFRSDLICSICPVVVEKNFRESALRPGRSLCCTMRSTLVKNRSLRSRLSGILAMISRDSATSPPRDPARPATDLSRLQMATASKGRRADSV